MLFLSRRLRPARSQDESGIALAEIMTAAIIIVLILTANAYALLSAYTAYGTAESANKAYQIINKQFAYFRQAPFSQLGTVTQPSAVPSCDAYTSPFNGETVTTLSAASSYKGSSDVNNVSPIPFQLCQAIQYPSQAQPVTLYDLAGNRKTTSSGANTPGGLGVTYTYQTVITNVSTTSFDSTSQPEVSDSTTTYNPKRITVTVKWTENDSTGVSKTQQVRLSTIRVPLVSECVPGGVKDSNGAPIVMTGCAGS